MMMTTPKNPTFRFLNFSLCAFLFLLPLLFISPTAKGQNAAKSPALRKHLLISTDSLAKQLNDTKIVVLHVARDRAHYDAGHIPGARFLLISDILTTRAGVANELPAVKKLEQVFSSLGAGNDSRIVLYGDNQGMLAARVYYTLDYLGFGDKAAMLDGGLEKWKAEKREISAAVPAIKAAKFTSRVNPGVFVTRETVSQSTTDNSKTVLIDGRPMDDYTGAKAQSGAKAGHIPGASCIYWMKHLESKENPALRPVDELRKMYDAIGAGTDKKLVTYCNSGMQASFSYFIAKYLGYDVALYDGSFSEWLMQPDAPVISGEKK